MTRDQAIAAIVRGLPYPQHIKDWDTSNEDSVRFTWRDDRFRLDINYVSLEQVDKGCLVGSNLAIALESLIKDAHCALKLKVAV